MGFYTYSIRKRLFDGLSTRRPGFKPDVLCMRFLVYKASLRKGFLRVLRHTVVRIIRPMLHKHLHLQIHSQKATWAKLKSPGIKFVLLLKPGAFVGGKKKKYFRRLVLQTFKADDVSTCALHDYFSNRKAVLPIQHTRLASQWSSGIPASDSGISNIA